MRNSAMRAGNLLFDLDGTLADPLEAFASSMDFACDRLSVARLTRDTMRALIGPPLHVALPTVLGPSAAAADELIRVYREHHAEIGLYRYVFYPGMDEALRALRSHHRLFVATSKPKLYTDRLFTHFGKSVLFDAIYGGELSGLRTDKSELIAHAVAESGLQPSDTIMIGDRKHDI